MANIQALLPGRTYNFRVVANSNNGPGESSISFEVSTQPEENISTPPLDLQATAVNHTSININWKVPLQTYGNITKYRIYYSEDEGAELYTDSHTVEAQLSELRPFTEYTISVVPFNQNGMGEPSNELIVKTHTAMPSEPPINMTIETTSSTVCYLQLFVIKYLTYNNFAILVTNRSMGASAKRIPKWTDYWL